MEVDPAASQALALAISGVALVFGALGCAVAVFALLRGAPLRLEALTQDCVTRLQTVEAAWGAARSELTAILDSIQTERENVQRTRARLSASESRAQNNAPLSRSDELAGYRTRAGMT